MKDLKILCYALILAFSACSKEGEQLPESEATDQLSKWMDEGEISGSLNPFPLVDEPDYSLVHELDFLRDDELVFISKSCGTILVYPLRSMFVEAVNEAYNGVYMAVTYCPITRSGISINRLQGNDTLLLTASGYLFRENMVPLDLKSGSLWSQMQLTGLAGAIHARDFETFPLLETTWGTVKQYFPSAGVYIVDSFRKNTKATEQPYGIIGREKVELFNLGMFSDKISLFHTTVQPGGKVVVAGSANYHFIAAFETSRNMEAVQDFFPVIMKDETGTFWNIFGEAVSGPGGGEILESPTAYTAADWAWRAFFENVSYFVSSPEEFQK